MSSSFFAFICQNLWLVEFRISYHHRKSSVQNRKITGFVVDKDIKMSIIPSQMFLELVAAVFMGVFIGTITEKISGYSHKNNDCVHLK